MRYAAIAARGPVTNLSLVPPCPFICGTCTASSALCASRAGTGSSASHATSSRMRVTKSKGWPTRASCSRIRCSQCSRSHMTCMNDRVHSPIRVVLPPRLHVNQKGSGISSG